MIHYIQTFFLCNNRRSIESLAGKVGNLSENHTEEGGGDGEGGGAGSYVGMAH